MYPFGYPVMAHVGRAVVYAWSMYEAIIKRQVKQATDYAYWTGAAIGMAAGAALGVMVGLVW